ncbi:MAG: tetratricopeptide (TPR) repeat protein [Myxococcota bacterium]|jgi:tetratricopeptide (TPR) repeat protein
MPRAPKLKAAGDNGTLTIEEIVSAQQAALATWPANHYSSAIGYECGLAEVMAALGRPDEALKLLDRSNRDCWVYHRYRSSYGVALQLIGRGERAAAQSLTVKLDAEVARRRFIGETRTVTRGASATVWHRLGDAERCRLALADAHQAALDEPSNPTQPWPHLSQAYALCGRFDEALEALTHGSSFREVALSQITRQAVAAGRPGALDVALRADGVGSYHLPEILYTLLDRLRLERDRPLCTVLLPQLIGRSREDDVEALLWGWKRGGFEDDAAALAKLWHARKPGPRAASALAICGQPGPGRALLAALPELKWDAQARPWAGLLAALGETERAGALWEGEGRRAVLVHAADQAWLAGHRDGASVLLSAADELVDTPLARAQIGAAVMRWGDTTAAAVHFTQARKALVALKGRDRSGGLDQLARIHGEVGDIPGGQATATKLSIGNQRDRALDALSAAALRVEDVAAAMVLAQSMKAPPERVKAIARVLQTVARRQGVLSPSMIALSIYWLER